MLLLRDAKSEMAPYLSNEDDVIDDLERRGAALVASTPNIFHYEGGSLFNPVTVAAAVGATTATAAVVTLTAESYRAHGSDNLTSLTVGDQAIMINTTTGDIATVLVTGANHLVNTPTFNGFSANTGVYPAHMQEANYALGYNATAASARQFTLTWLGGTALNAAGFLGNGTVISAYTGTLPEGGYYQMEAKQYDFAKFTADFQILDTPYMATMTAAGTQMSFPIDGKRQTWDIQTAMTVKRARLGEGLAAFHGPGGTTTYQGRQMTLVRGLFPLIKQRGNRFVYSGGSWGAAELTALTIALAKNNAYRSFTLYGGVDLISKIQAALLTMGANGALLYGNLGNGDTVSKMSLTGFSLNGISIFFKIGGAFTHRTTFGLSNTMQGSGLLYPNKNTSGTNADGSPFDNQAVQIRYIAREGQRYLEVKTGPETQRRDVKGLDITTQFALQASGVREMYTIEPGA